MRVLRPGTASKTISPALAAVAVGPAELDELLTAEAHAPDPPGLRNGRNLGRRRGSASRGISARLARIATSAARMDGGNLRPQAARGKRPRLAAIQAERVGHRLAEQQIADGGEDEPERGFVDRPVLMAGAEPVDDLVDRIEDRIERVAIAGEDHPGGERAGALAPEGVEGAVDDSDRVGLAGPAQPTASAMPAQTRSLIRPARAACSPAPSRNDGADWRGSCRSRSDRLQRHRLRALVDQQPARRLERGGAALFGVRRSRLIDIYVSKLSSFPGDEHGERYTPRPDHHAARPAFRPRHATGPLVDGRRPVATTAFYNALSATFPKGEAFFVESVRQFREGAPPKLAGEIKAFTTQEVIHSREHVASTARGRCRL